ncbi:MAG: hypothetical protein GY772_00680 [bacterium]|nr:hypothetical protein [bacterium]
MILRAHRLREPPFLPMGLDNVRDLVRGDGNASRRSGADRRGSVAFAPSVKQPRLPGQIVGNVLPPSFGALLGQLSFGTAKGTEGSVPKGEDPFGVNSPKEIRRVGPLAAHQPHVREDGALKAADLTLATLARRFAKQNLKRPKAPIQQERLADYA